MGTEGALGASNLGVWGGEGRLGASTLGASTLGRLGRLGASSLGFGRDGADGAEGVSGLGISADGPAGVDMNSFKVREEGLQPLLYVKPEICAVSFFTDGKDAACFGQCQSNDF